MAVIDLEKVWYRSDVNRWRDLQFLAMQDTGILTVDKLALNYHGKKENVCIFDIKRISLCKQGRDFVNTWIKIEYQIDKTAYFADGGYLGWRGTFGGTRKIYQLLCQNIPNIGLQIDLAARVD